MPEYRRDQFRTDPSIALEMAYKVAENYCMKKRDPTDSVPQEEKHTVSYDIWISDNKTTKVEEQSKISKDKHDQVTPPSMAATSDGFTDEMPEHIIDEYGKPPYPDRRVFITYGGPQINIKICYDREVLGSTGNAFYDRSRTFVPMAYPRGEPHHRYISSDKLVDWFEEFVPGHVRDIRGKKDFNFVVDRRSKEDLIHLFVEFLLGLPTPPISGYGDGHNYDEPVNQDFVFEPTYLMGALYVNHSFARKLCWDMITDDQRPITKLEPPGDNNRFERDEYVIGLEEYWGDVDEYDYSTFICRCCSMLSRIRG